MKVSCAYVVVSIFFLTLLYSCTKDYSYEGSPVSSGYLIKDIDNNCTLASVSGNFKVSKNLTDSNFVTVQVHVSHSGSYSISSDNVNGYSFKASGTFSDTGNVLVHLPGRGKPLTAGVNVLNVSYDSSLCQVTVTVEDTISNEVVTINPDHFPLTANSHWSYDDLSYPGDSILRSLSGIVSQNNIPHEELDEYVSFFATTNAQYYRKSGADYYRYTSVSVFTSALNYSPSIYDDLNFLKENIRTGDDWYSNTYSGRTSITTQVLVLRYHFLCLDADATVQVNGKTFAHVYKIQMIPEVSDPGVTPAATGEIHTYFYAKGVGLIYSEFFNGVLSHPEMQIRKWVVN